MKRKEYGFSLLEAAIAILLFAVLIQMLTSFFFTVYVNSKNFQHKSFLLDNANAVNALIKEKVREADEVQIKVVGIATPYDPILSSTDNVEIPEGNLEELVIGYDEGGTKKYIKFRVVARTSGDSKKKGKYELRYGTYDTPLGSPTSESIISDQVESVKVSRKKDSDNILISIVYQVETPQKTSKDVVKDNFSVSLAYKGKVS